MSNESMLNTNQQSTGMAGIVDTLIMYVGALFFFLFPITYVTQTTEFTEYPKIALTMAVVVLLMVLWGLKFIVSQKFSLLSTPLNLGFILLIGVLILSTVFSVSPFNSLYGQFNVWHFTLPEITAFIVIFYALASVDNVRSAVRMYLTAFLASSVVLSVLVILGYFNVFDGLATSATQLNIFSVLSLNGFSPAGNMFSTWFILGSALILGGFLLKFTRLQDGAVASMVLGPKSLSAIKAIVGVAIFFNAIALVLVLGAYIPGVPERFTPPAQLNVTESWRVASSAIRDRAFLGTGPSTYNVAYNAYRSGSLNQTSEWNVAFYRAGNEYFTWITTTGILGFAALMYIVGKLLVMSVSAIRRGDNTQAGLPYDGNGVLNLRKPLASLVLLTLVFFLFFPSTAAILGTLFLFLTLWMLVERMDDVAGLASVNTIKVGDMTEKLNMQSTSQVSAGGAFPIVVGLLIIVIAGFTGFYLVQDVRSNLVYADSAQYLTENRPARDVYIAQQQAIQLNPRRDSYRVAYANTNISTAQAIAAERGESLTDTQRQEVVQLIQQALREIRIATELLNPYSASNWDVRGRIYQSLLGVATGADRWALQAYQQAVVLAPQDPRLRVDLGGLYFALATTDIEEGTQGTAPGDNVPTVPETQQANLLRAISSYQDAVRLKPDYANAHYNLGLAYEEAGRTDLALQEFETTLSLLEEGNDDYNQTQEKIEALQSEVSLTPTPAPTASPTPTVEATPTEEPTPTPTIEEGEQPTPTTIATPTEEPTPAP